MEDYLSIKRKKLLTDNIMDESQKHSTKQKRPNTKKYIVTLHENLEQTNLI